MNVKFRAIFRHLKSSKEKQFYLEINWIER